jgi:ubiquinone/menaquinone biosynthesis C-methylase UbiE
MRVLEIGCGSGLDLPLLVDAVGDDTVYGVDVSPRMLGQDFQREGHGQPTSYEREPIDSSD